MPDPLLVTSNVLDQDGIEYAISVYHKVTGYFAIWKCNTCNREGVGTSSLPDQDAAINACRVLIAQHHAEHHS